MSQNGTTPTTDENRPPATIPTPLYVPMMPMPLFFPYGNANPTAQQFYAPPIYPNVSAYPSNGNHRQGNFGLGYNTFYAPFYPPPNNMLSSAAHLANSSALIPPRSLMGPTLIAPPPPPPPQQQQQQQQHSSVGSSIVGSDTERNKNLNIRECQSPILNQTKKREKKVLQIVHPNANNTSVRIRKDSSSTSSLVSHPELDQIPPPPLSSSSSAQEIDSDNNPQDDFLTFIEQKTKTTTTTMPELNPFANEFSFINDKTLTKDSPITTNGIDHNTSNENHSSYRLLFDNLIEKSLESIEAIKNSTKKASVHDISIQCNQTYDCMNRSTQTTDQTNNSDLITDYSLRTINLMDKLLENFRSIYQNELHNECKTMAHTCDELRHLILFIHRATSSSDNDEQQSTSSIDLNNPFSTMVQNLANDMTNINKYQTSSRIPHSVGRGTRRLMTSTNNSPIPSFSCRQIDPITIVKLCLLCQKPLDDSDDVMHKLCRSLSSHPNMSTNT